MTQPTKSRRGFASLTPERRKEVARLGGRAAHESGNAHEFTPEEASAAGKKGQENARARAAQATG